MKLKNILFPCIVFCTIQLSFAQNNPDSTFQPDNNNTPKSSIKDKLIYNIGGNFWIGSTTNIGLMPQVGYKITDKFIAGVGLNFQYYKNTYYSNDPYLIYGGNVFTRYFVNPTLYLQAEYQALQYDGNLGGYALLGGGFTPNNHVYVSAYYILHSPINNAYGAPYIVRVGFML